MSSAWIDCLVELLLVACEISSQFSPEPSFISYRAFPQSQHVPSSLSQKGALLPVAFSCLSDFGFPKCSVGRRECTFSAAAVMVPKTAVNKNCCSQRWNKKIWFSGENGGIAPIPNTQMSERTSNSLLRRRSTGADERHLLTLS